MSDLIERLRHAAFVRFHDGWESYTLAADAATRIETLERKVEELRAATIEECAKLADERASGYEAEGRDVRNSPDDKRFSASVAVRLRGLAAAIRRIKPSEAEGREG